MKLRQLIAIKSTISLTAGLIFMLAPGVVLAYFAVPNNEPSGLFFLARCYGAILFLLGFLLWLSRSLSEPDVCRVIVPSVALGDALNLVVVLVGQASEMMNDLGWFVIAYYLFSMLALGAGMLPKRSSRSQASSSN
ncbi:MAG: hypothetical protein HZB51_18015 [Chloroflexi bacterium]|nr:hypothetical protein [Chloroflexota bacterium]